MLASAYNPNPAIVQTLLQVGAKVNAEDEYGRLPYILLLDITKMLRIPKLSGYFLGKRVRM